MARTGLPLERLLRQRYWLFLIRALLVLVEGGSLSAATRLFFAVCVLGRDTTFSSHSYETLQLITAGNVGAAFVDVLGQLLASFIGVYLGGDCQARSSMRLMIPRFGIV